MILLDNNSDTRLIFDQWGEISVLDISDVSQTRDIEVKNNTHLKWYSFVVWENSQKLTFTTHSWSSRVAALVIANASDRPTLHIASHLDQSQTKTDVHIIALVADQGNIVVDWSIHIHEHIAGVSGHILEENIFLGSQGSIRWIPSLFVHSDDVEAGHAARIERVSDEKLYYLRARGMPRDDATMVMIRDRLARLFEGLDEAEYAKIWEQVLEKIRN